MAKHYRDMQSILDVLGDSDEDPDLGEGDTEVMLIVIGNTRKSLCSQTIRFWSQLPLQKLTF